MSPGTHRLPARAREPCQRCDPAQTLANRATRGRCPDIQLSARGGPGDVRLRISRLRLRRSTATRGAPRRCTRAEWPAIGCEFPQHVVRSREPAGSETMLTRMAELMFVEVVRRHVAIALRRARRVGWRDSADAVVGPGAASSARTAGACMDAAGSGAIRSERREQCSWSVSRRWSGVPPMQYLTQWRTARVSGSGPTRARIGKGGDDRRASSGTNRRQRSARAFKRATGHGPSAWRSARQGDVALGTRGLSAPQRPRRS